MGDRTDANGFDGGASDLSGLGIEVTGYTTAPSGTNIAWGTTTSPTAALHRSADYRCCKS